MVVAVVVVIVVVVVVVVVEVVVSTFLRFEQSEGPELQVVLPILSEHPFSNAQVSFSSWSSGEYQE